jgi:hypothetical protein
MSNNSRYFANSITRWVFSERLPQQQRVGHQFYSLTNNTDGKPLDGLSWKIAYGDGSGASGVVYADRVKVGGVTATSQAVEAATSISAQFINEHSDGLLGLGFGNTNTIKPTKQPTFFENIKPSLKDPLFTVTLKKNATGIYDFGYIDPQKYIVCLSPLLHRKPQLTLQKGTTPIRSHQHNPRLLGIHNNRFRRRRWPPNKNHLPIHRRHRNNTTSPPPRRSPSLLCQRHRRRQ